VAKVQSGRRSIADSRDAQAAIQGQRTKKGDDHLLLKQAIASLSESATMLGNMGRQIAIISEHVFLAILRSFPNGGSIVDRDLKLLFEQECKESESFGEDKIPGAWLEEDEDSDS
jgi:hypothetical protein